MKNKIRELLVSDMGLTRVVVNELNWYNGSLEFLEVYDMEEFNQFMEECEPTEIANKIFYGEFNPNDEYFRFDAYANLESLDEYDLHEDYKIYMTEIIDALINNYEDLDIEDERLIDIIEAEKIVEGE